MTIYQGDAYDVLRDIESESVDSCVTSPPYWDLRDYGVPEQIGREATYNEYLTKLWVIFSEVKRVLRKEGTCWVVMGDTYDDRKNLCMIPERFAMGMTDGRGWTLRNKVVWHKPNVFPSSTKDRFTIDWEYLFFFVKSQKYYFETQYEKLQQPNPSGLCPIGGKKHAKAVGETYSGNEYIPNHTNGRIRRCVWSIPTDHYPDAHFAVFPPALIETPILAGCPVGGTVLDPFCGSGTTGVVAHKLGRKFVGIELNPDYIKLAEKRLGLRQMNIDAFVKKEKEFSCLV